MSSIQTIKQNIIGKWCHVDSYKQEINKIQKHTFKLHNKLSKLTDMLALHYEKFALKNEQLIQYEIIIDSKDQYLAQLKQVNKKVADKIKNIGVACHQKKQQIQGKKKDVDKQTIGEHQENMTLSEVAKTIQNLRQQITKGKQQLHLIKVKKQHYKNVLILNQQLNIKKQKIEQQVLKIERQMSIQVTKTEQIHSKIQKITKIINQKQRNNEKLKNNLQRQKQIIVSARIQEGNMFEQRRELFKLRKKYQNLNKQNIYADEQIKNQQESLQFKTSILDKLKLQLRQIQDQNYLRQNYTEFYYANQKNEGNLQTQKDNKFSPQLTGFQKGFYIIQSERDEANSKQVMRKDQNDNNKDPFQSDQVISVTSSHRKNGSIADKRNIKNDLEQNPKIKPNEVKDYKKNLQSVKGKHVQEKSQREQQQFKKNNHSLRQTQMQQGNNDKKINKHASQQLETLISRYLQIKNKTVY